MAEAGRVATLYKDIQRKMSSAIPTVQSRETFHSLDETLASMKPMIREIDPSNQEIILLLKILGDQLWDCRWNLPEHNPPYIAALQHINWKLKRFLGDYVHSCLSNIDDEVEEDDPKNKLRKLLNRLFGMMITEEHRAAEPTKFVFKILDLTLDALRRQLDGDELEYTDRYLPPLKKLEVLVPFHRYQYWIETLKILELQLRSLLPEQVRQPLDLRIKELEEKIKAKEKMEKMIVVIIVIAIVMFSYIEKWNAFLIFIFLILIIVVMAYIWYLHQLIKRKSPELFNDVFLSCKSDILETHANPLNRALKNIKLRTFYYVDRNDLGRRIEEKLQEGVKHSASAIIIFSKEFASSNWCLYELVLILERHRTSFYPIIPIYCDGVKHTDLSFANGISIYNEALENHKKIYGEEKVKQWKETLQDFGGRIARRATGSESELTMFFDEVAKDIKEEITRPRFP